MLPHQKILAVIPARGGSKGVPHKNIRKVCGRPLISYTIQAALAINTPLHRIIVSTDDKEISEIARQEGAEVPFVRPSDLSGDETPTLPVVQHAVHFVENLDRAKLDWVLLLQPTAPLRTVEDIEASIALTRESVCDSVISVERTLAHHPKLMKRIVDDQLVPYYGEPSSKWEGRRQDLRPKAYLRNGAIYLTRRDVIMENSSLFGSSIRPYVMPPERSISIDSELDLLTAQYMIQEKLQESQIPDQDSEDMEGPAPTEFAQNGSIAGNQTVRERIPTKDPLLAIDHVGIVVNDIDKAGKRYESLLGFKAQTEVILDETQRVYIQFYVNGKGERLELIQPVDETSPSYNAPKKGGGVNHVGYRCPDINNALDRARRQNCVIVVPPVPGAGHGGRMIAFVVHPDFGLTEFVEHKDWS